MVIQAIFLLDTLDKDVNSFSMRVRYDTGIYTYYKFSSWNYDFLPWTISKTFNLLYPSEEFVNCIILIKLGYEIEKKRKEIIILCILICHFSAENGTLGIFLNW